MSLNFRKVVPHAKAPVQNSDGSYDLYSANNYIVESGDNAMISIGIEVSIPMGYNARVYSISTAETHNIEVSNFCSINYHAHKYQTNKQTVKELRIKLYNYGFVDYNVAQGQLVAVLVLHQIKRLPICEVSSLKNITDDFSVKVKLRNVKNFPSRVRTWFIGDYKIKPIPMTERYTTPEMREALEEYKQTQEYVKSKTRLDLEAKFLFTEIKKATEATGDPPMTPFQRLKEAHSLAKARAQQ